MPEKYELQLLEPSMSRPRLITLAIAALLLGRIFVLAALAKDKRPPLPLAFLSAHTVAVVVDPTAGVSIEDPRANQVAQKDVETALANWGRFLPVIGAEQADLIIVIRRGSGKLATATISDPRQNNHAGVINPTDDGISAGAQHGTQPPLSSGSRFPESQSPRPQAEIGGTEDSFLVFE